MFYLTTHSTHFIYGYMVSDIWLRTILIVRKETCCRQIGYSYQLTARVLLYAPSHRQDNTYHGLCYTSHGATTACSECTLIVTITGQSYLCRFQIKGHLDTTLKSFVRSTVVELILIRLFHVYIHLHICVKFPQPITDTYSYTI